MTVRSVCLQSPELVAGCSDGSRCCRCSPGSTRHILYFWQGIDSSIEEKGSSALLATKVDDDLGGAAVQVLLSLGAE